MDHVVTAFLRERDEVLLVRRSDEVGTYRGKWGSVSGYVEGDPAEAEDDARRELREEVGAADATLVRAGDPLRVGDAEGEWTVHPFLFEARGREVTPNYELAAVEWVPPTAMLDRETVPGLWEAYRRVAPTAETVRDDAAHGSAWLSARALEALRDAAATADDRSAVAEAARELRDARPSMAAVANRVNRVMATADPEPAAVADAAHDALREALDADDEAAAAAADLVDGPVATLSRSGTVLAALRRATPAVLLSESRPGREGVGVAESLVAAGADVTLTTDAALPSLLEAHDVSLVLVGADAVLADGSVVNKVGTRALALAAAEAGVDCYAAAARAKVRPDEAFRGESRDAGEVYDGDADVSVANPVFDRTPVRLVTGVVTEAGVLDADGVREAAERHREYAAWDDERRE